MNCENFCELIDLKAVSYFCFLVATTEGSRRRTTSKPATQKRHACGSEFGCCSDGLLPALGPNYLGCPGAYNMSTL